MLSVAVKIYHCAGQISVDLKCYASLILRTVISRHTLGQISVDLKCYASLILRTVISRHTLEQISVDLKCYASLILRTVISRHTLRCYDSFIMFVILDCIIILLYQSSLWVQHFQ